MFFRLRGRGKLPETRFSGIAVNDVDFALATKFWPIFQNATADLASKHWTQRHRSWLAGLAVRRHRAMGFPSARIIRNLRVWCRRMRPSAGARM
jgi:hypothetical protein